jgi:hypothetical protein
MLVLVAACLLCSGLLFSLPGFAQDVTVEHVLRAHAFNRAFEGFAFYSVTIEDDQLQADGSREVTAVASGRFLESTKRVKVLVLMVGEQVIGGQVLQEAGLPPCLTPKEGPASSL